jgi:hypothetical protein
VEQNEKCSKTLKLYWKNVVIKTGKPRKGFPHTPEQIEKIRKSSIGRNQGEKNGNWRNGASKNLYRGENWKHIKTMIYRRDNYKCTKCGSTYKIQCHHIIPWRISHDSSPKNLTTLCRPCHTKEDNRIIREQKQKECK